MSTKDVLLDAVMALLYFAMLFLLAFGLVMIDGGKAVVGAILLVLGVVCFVSWGVMFESRR